MVKREQIQERLKRTIIDEFGKEGSLFVGSFSLFRAIVFPEKNVG